jgi:hypothetical protein
MPGRHDPEPTWFRDHKVVRANFVPSLFNADSFKFTLQIGPIGPIGTVNVYPRANLQQSDGVTVFKNESLSTRAVT